MVTGGWGGWLGAAKHGPQAAEGSWARRVPGEQACGRASSGWKTSGCGGANLPGAEGGGAEQQEIPAPGTPQCLQVKTWPKRWALPTWGRVTIVLRAACGIEPPSQRPLERASGANRAGGTSLGQSLPHTRSLWRGNDPTHKLQGQQPYMAARYEALLNKDKEEDPAFSPVPSPGLHFRQPCSRQGSQVSLDLLWLVGSPSHPPRETHPACPKECQRPQSTAGHRGRAGACSAPGSLSFSGTKQPVFIRKRLAASPPPEIWDHHPSSACFHRPFSPE